MSSSRTASKATGKAAGAKRASVPAKAKKGKPTRKAPKLAAAEKAATAVKSPSADAVSTQMIATAAAIEKMISAGDLEGLPNESLQKLMAAAVKAYSAKREAGETFLPVSTAGRVTPTDIMLTSSQLLRAGNLQVFELGMWQSWTGN